MKNASIIKRAAFMAVLDTFIITACAYIAMLTRWAPIIPEDALSETNTGLIRLLISYIAVFVGFGMYKVRWRSLDMSLLFRQALGCIVGLGISLVWEELLDLSQSRRYYLLIAFAFIIAGICGSRVVMKLIRDWKAARLGDRNLGICRMTVSEGEEPGSLLICVQDKPVEGGEDEIENIASQYGVTEIVVCLSPEDGEYLDRITSICLSTGCFVRRI